MFDHMILLSQHDAVVDSNDPIEIFKLSKQPFNTKHILRSPTAANAPVRDQHRGHHQGAHAESIPGALRSPPEVSVCPPGRHMV